MSERDGEVEEASGGTQTATATARTAACATIAAAFSRTIVPPAQRERREQAERAVLVLSRE